MFVSVCVPPLLQMNQRDADDFSLKKIKIRLTVRWKTLHAIEPSRKYYYTLSFFLENAIKDYYNFVVV